MSKIVFANKLQYEVLNSDKRITIITAEPGAGATTSLILKAIQSCTERKINCSFFVPSVRSAMAEGGVVDKLKSLLRDVTRFSEKSLIFTFTNDAKIKIVPCQGDWALESTMGLSRDLMLFDANIGDEFIIYHLPRAYEAVVVDNVNDLEQADSWANKLNLLERKNGQIVGFCQDINHITSSLDDNYLFPDRERYKELVKTHIPERLRVEF